METIAEHPFYTDDGTWIAAAALTVGEEIVTLSGEYGTVEQVQIIPASQPMYNLTVEEAHTFFVGEAGWLVHNQDSRNPIAYDQQQSFDYFTNRYGSSDVEKLRS